VTLSGEALSESLGDPVTAGVGVGLALGKPLGIALFTWLAIRLGLGALPTGTRWSHMIGVGMAGGVGFTVALFIAGLSFDDAGLTDAAKVGILAGSLISGVAAYAWLRARQPVVEPP